jgi:hypothetical protein
MFCSREFSTVRALKLHATKSKTCREHWEAETHRPLPHVPDEDTSGDDNTVPDSASGDDNTIPISTTLPQLDEMFDNTLFLDEDQLPTETHPSHSLDPNASPPDHPSKKRRVLVEEEEDEDACPRYPLKYPSEAATVLGKGKTAFEALREEQVSNGQAPWSPFQDEDEWGLADWLMKNVTKSATEDYLKLPIVCGFSNAI